MASGDRAGEAATAATSRSMVGELVAHDRLEVAPLGLARAHHAVERLGEARQHGRGARLRLGLALLAARPPPARP